MKSGPSKSNSDLVEDLMSHSPYGGLCQVFIIEALNQYCAYVKTHNPISENGFINPKAWLGIAEDISTRIDNFYGAKEYEHTEKLNSVAQQTSETAESSRIITFK